MVKNLSSLLAANSSRFGYSEPVVKSLKMELHAVNERISSLKAGLKTWQDHLRRIRGLEDSRLDEIKAAESELKDVAVIVVDCEKETKTHKEMREQLEWCQVSVLEAKKSCCGFLSSTRYQLYNRSSSSSSAPPGINRSRFQLGERRKMRLLWEGETREEEPTAADFLQKKLGTCWPSFFKLHDVGGVYSKRNGVKYFPVHSNVAVCVRAYVLVVS